MKFTRHTIVVLLCAVLTNCYFVHCTPSSNSTKNETEGAVQFSGWKPMVKPEALTTTEFVEKLEVAQVAKAQNSSDMEAADSKRSFILVYPPRASATDQKPQEQEPPPSQGRSQGGPPLRSYPTQSRYQRMRNIGVPEGTSEQVRKAPTVYQRPKFPPVENPPPVPEHALRNRQRIPPNFTPESTSRHQVQIQLLDGYIVPPSGGGASNIQAEKKAPQITTFPLNLNNVPEIRLLLPGDVHAQLNNLRPPNQQQQNRPSGAYVAPQNSDGRNNGPQRDFQPEKNIYSFESQRRPGRTAEYSYTNNNNNNNNNGDTNNVRPPTSPRDPAIYPETVNFPGQNFQNSINNAISYNTGGVPSNSGISNQGRYPDDARSQGPHMKHHDGQNYPQNYAGQLNPVTDNRGSISHTTTNVAGNGQNFPQNYANGQNFGADTRGPTTHTKTHDSTGGQGFPLNYGGGQNLGTDNRGPITHTKIHDTTNGQGFPLNYGGGQNLGTGNRGPNTHTQTHNTINGQVFPQNYGAGQNFGTENRGPTTHTKTHSGTNGQLLPQNYGAQPSIVTDNRGYISQTHINDGATGNAFPTNYDSAQNPANDNRSPVTQVKIDDSPNVSNYGGQQIPSVDNRTPVVNSRPQGTTNGQTIPQNFVQQKYEPDDIQTGQVPIDPFQGTRDFENRFRPLTTNTQNARNGNSDQTPQNYNRDGSRTKTNQNGWRATPASGGNQNYNPGGVSPGKTNFYSGDVGNQNTKTNRGQPNGQSGPNFNYFGTGTDRQDSRGNRSGPNHHKTHSGSPSSSGQDNRNRPIKTHTNPESPSSSDRDHESRKSHGSAFSPSSSDRDHDSRKSHGSAFSPSSSDRDHERGKSHGSAHSPSSSDQDSRSRPGHMKSHGNSHDTRNRPQHDKSHGSAFSSSSSGRIIAAEEEETNQPDIEVKTPDSRGSTDDIYFVPPVLTQGQEQIQIEPFDDTASRDAINKPVDSTGLGNGGLTVNEDYVSVETGDKTMTFARQGLCDCTQNCAPIQRSPNENLGSSIREIARSLDADAFFDFVGLTDEEIENILASEGSYTLFIPSNDAVSRLPSNLIDHWRENNPDLRLALLNHVVRDRIPLDQLKLGGRMTSRANDATIFINNYNNEAVTVNGHRIVHGDVSAPKDGTIHIIDGTLCPVADQDIINTLRTCNKYDGFLTLADVTKLLETMQDDGPYTVFLPSNEALTKIPPDELAVLKENSTSLREFLQYHIVKGAYFSGDLKDGQYLTTLHQRQPIRMGVRADGCYRRLVEANNSPLFKADIPTKNGVIHVVDWILRPSDLQWCEGVILP